MAKVIALPSTLLGVPGPSPESQINRMVDRVIEGALIIRDGKRAANLSCTDPRLSLVPTSKPRLPSTPTRAEAASSPLSAAPTTPEQPLDKPGSVLDAPSPDSKPTVKVVRYLSHLVPVPS